MFHRSWETRWEVAMGIIENGGMMHWGPGLLALFAVPVILVSLALTRASSRRRRATVLAGLALVIIYGVNPLIMNSRVSGVVVDEDGSPVEATAIVRHARTSVDQVVRTDAEGRFRVPLDDGAPEDYSLLLCSTRTGPLRIPQLPRSTIGRLRFTMRLGIHQSTGIEARWTNRCAEVR